MAAPIASSSSSGSSFLMKTDGREEIHFTLNPNHQLECHIDGRESVWLTGDQIVASPRCSEEALLDINVFKRGLRSFHPLCADQVERFRRSFKISMIISQDRYFPPKDTLERSKQVMLDKIQWIENPQKKDASIVIGIGFWSAILFPPLAPITLPLALIGVGAKVASESKLEPIKDCISHQPNHIWRSEYNTRKERFENSSFSFLLEVEPISKKSRLDPRVRVSEYQWTVALASYGLYGHHAKIITEGIVDGEYRMQTYELVGQSTAITRTYRPDELGEYGEDIWKARTRIWKVPLEKIEQLSVCFFDNPEHKFSLLPAKGETNCCLWALDLLRRAEIVDLKIADSFLGIETSFKVGDYMEFRNKPILISDLSMYDFGANRDAQKEWVSI